MKMFNDGFFAEGKTVNSKDFYNDNYNGAQTPDILIMDTPELPVIALPPVTALPPIDPMILPNELQPTRQPPQPEPTSYMPEVVTPTVTTENSISKPPKQITKQRFNRTFQHPAIVETVQDNDAESSGFFDTLLEYKWYIGAGLVGLYIVTKD